MQTPQIDEKIRVRITSVYRGGVGVLATSKEYGKIYIPRLCTYKPVAELEGMVGHEFFVRVIEVGDNTKSHICKIHKCVSPKILNGENIEYCDIRVDDDVDGTIIGISKFGLTLKVDSVIGLIHNSELAWDGSKKADDFKIGDIVKAKVININLSEGQISFSIKKLEPSPWANLQFKVGDKVTGLVIKTMQYGTILNVNGVVGLLHNSKMGLHKQYMVGDTVDVRVIEIDNENCKISFSTKKSDDETINLYKIGMTFDTEVLNVVKYGTFTGTGDGVCGLIHCQSIPGFEYLEDQTKPKRKRGYFNCDMAKDVYIGRKIKVEVKEVVNEDGGLKIRFNLLEIK